MRTRYGVSPADSRAYQSSCYVTYDTDGYSFVFITATEGRSRTTRYSRQGRRPGHT